MRLLENWTRPRPGEPVVGFVVALEQGRLLCLGEDEMAVALPAEVLETWHRREKRAYRLAPYISVGSIAISGGGI